MMLFESGKPALQGTKVGGLRSKKTKKKVLFWFRMHDWIVLSFVRRSEKEREMVHGMSMPGFFCVS